MAGPINLEQVRARCVERGWEFVQESSYAAVAHTPNGPVNFHVRADRGWGAWSSNAAVAELEDLVAAGKRAPPTTFREAVRAGLARPEDIHHYVDQWHSSASPDALHTFLGLERAEFAQWLQHPKSLPIILGVEPTPVAYELHRGYPPHTAMVASMVLTLPTPITLSWIPMEPLEESYLLLQLDGADDYDEDGALGLAQLEEDLLKRADRDTGLPPSWALKDAAERLANALQARAPSPEPLPTHAPDSALEDAAQAAHSAAAAYLRAHDVAATPWAELPLHEKTYAKAKAAASLEGKTLAWTHERRRELLDEQLNTLRVRASGDSVAWSDSHLTPYDQLLPLNHAADRIFVATARAVLLEHRAPRPRVTVTEPPQREDASY